MTTSKRYTGNYSSYAVCPLTIFSAVYYNLQRTLSVSLVLAGLSMRWFWALGTEVLPFIGLISLFLEVFITINPAGKFPPPTLPLRWEGLEIFFTTCEGETFLCFTGVLIIGIVDFWRKFCLAWYFHLILLCIEMPLLIWGRYFYFFFSF